MSNKVIDQMAVCPFYRSEARVSITCEGLIPGTLTQTRFLTEADKAERQNLCCSYNYAECEHAAALMERYRK